MKHRKTTPVRRVFTLILLLCAVTTARFAAAGQLMRGQVPPAVKNLQAVDRLDGAKRLNLAVGLPLRNRESLTNLLRDIYDPASPRFHHYLTAAQFAERFGPTEQDYQAVARHARAHGLTVTAMHPNRTLLDVSGKAADIEQWLHVRMGVYHHPTEARTFFAPDADPMLDIDVPVLGISGLDDFMLPRPMNLKKAAWNTASNTVDSVTGSGPGNYFLGGDLRAAYAPGVTLNGAGQSVGLFELDGYFPSDIAEYESLARLPNVTLTNILLDGFNGAAGDANDEVALDIDMAISMAPGLLQVMIYEGSAPNDILNRMATDNQAKQLSSSWGFYPIVDPVREQIYQQFAAQGQTMFQASGDDGAYSGGIFPPSDDPNLTVVGGTSLTTAGPGGAWASETAWFGSGGGISTNFPIPSWQQGLNMSASQGSTTMRNIPDVSCLSDVLIWLIFNNGNQQPIGGTSAAAPLWAGFMALANQKAAANGQLSVGFLNPALYAIGQGGGYTQAFHDITTGNNTNDNSPTNFFAVPGYDLCTGWGTPTGSNLINALVSPPDALAVAPMTNIIVSGPVGGPFAASPPGFVLTDIGTNVFGWALGGGAFWLSPSSIGGAMAPGGSPITVTPGVTAAGSNLPAGSYTATVWFTNLGDRVAQSRQVVLDVVVQPFIIQQPVNQSLPNGATAVFTVGTAPNALLFYQWQFNSNNLSDGGNISGSSSGALTINNAGAANAGTYQVIVSNAAGAILSDTATLTIVSSAPVIVTQPASQALPQGASATFAVDAAGSAPLSYQWRLNSTNLADGGNVSGSGSSALTIANIVPGNSGTYSVIVSNALGTMQSSNAILTIGPASAPGASLSTLYSFTGGSDGGNPNGLMQDTNGDFYGTTQIGGTGSSGTVFQMTPDGTVTTLDSFSGAGGGGDFPGAALVQGPDGALYGTTAIGGSEGLGEIFRTTTNGVLTTLASFNGSGNGEVPAAVLALGADGAFYGTATFGGGNGDGTVFRVTTNGTLTTLAAFNFANGSEPNDLFLAANGNFYGTTFEGGANGNGTVFQISTNGRLSTVASFNYTNGGYLPYAGLVQTPDGNFYGTTFEGGAHGYGAVFQMSPSGVMTTVYSFSGGADGSHPAADLILSGDGNLYGTTVYGGMYNDGTVFRLAPGGGLVTLAQFDGYDGANPESPLTLGSDGNLYGTTESGGASNMGVAFRVNLNYPGVQISSQPASQDVFLGANAIFTVAVIGNGPLSYQWKENGTNLTDGPGVSGSTNRVLTLLAVTPADSAVYSVLVSNAGGSVLSANATLGVIESPPQIITGPANQTQTVGGTAMFIVMAQGDLPLAYQWQKNGTNLADGGQISGSSTSALTLANVVETNDGSYSVIVSNTLGAVPSAPGILTVYANSIGGTTMAAVHGFSGSDGGLPNALFSSSNGLLYGTTQNGGAYGLGTIFSLSTNGMLTTLVSFNGTNGATPLAAMAEDGNGLLYGTTELGGSNSAGTLFSMTPDGTLTSIYSFASNNDSIDPFTPLTPDAAGNFYGATQNNASPGNGNLFRLGLDGTVTTLYSFPGGVTGSMPAGAPVLGTDGNFYGATGNTQQNTSAYGNIYRMTPAGAVTNLYSFTGGADGYSPAGQLARGDDGNFYGVTRFNHISFHGFQQQFYGTIFKVTPAGALTTLYSLNGTVVYTDGLIPVAGLLHANDGNFYGTTLQGYNITVNGAVFNNSYGTVFRITPSGALTTLTSFNYTDDGATPRTALVQGPDGSLYGTTSTGGPGGQGTIYRISFTSAPQITFQPLSQTNVLGGTATFYVTTFGAPLLLYQWLQNGTNLTDGPNISGSTSRVLTLNNLAPAQAGAYSVIVSNAVGWQTSSPAQLVLEARPFIETITQTSSTFACTWSAMPQRKYQVQSTTNLSPPAWTNLGGPIIATNVVMGASDTLSPGQKFYRVVLSP